MFNTVLIGFGTKICEYFSFGLLNTMSVLKCILWAYKFQSAFRIHHITQSTLVKVTTDLFLSLDLGNHATLILVNLSSAFSTVDHSILEHVVSFEGQDLQW